MKELVLRWSHKPILSWRIKVANVAHAEQAANARNDQTSNKRLKLKTLEKIRPESETAKMLLGLRISMLIAAADANK